MNKPAAALCFFLAVAWATSSLAQEAKTEEDMKIDALLRDMRKVETGEGAARGVEVTQRKAVKAIAALRTDRALKLLLGFLEDRTLDDWARYDTASVFRTWKVEAATEPLLRVLKDKDSAPPPRAGAAYALGNLQVEKAVPSLIEALAGPEMIIKMGAVHALGQIGTEAAVDGLLLAARNTEGYIRRLAYPHLIRLRPEGKIRFLVAALRDDEWGAREDAVKSFVEIGMPAVGVLLELANDKNSAVRWQAVRLLGKIGSGTTLEILLRSLRDEDWMVRNEAAVALAKMNSVRAVEPLLALLKDNSASAREEAGWILGEMKVMTAVDPLIRALGDPDIGWMAAMSLGKISSDRAVGPLAAILRNGPDRARRAAAWALGKTAVKEAAAHLRAALEDRDEEVRYWAALALK